MNGAVDEVGVARGEGQAGCVDGVEVGEDFELEFIWKGGKRGFLLLLFLSLFCFCFCFCFFDVFVFFFRRLGERLRCLEEMGRHGHGNDA